MLFDEGYRFINFDVTSLFSNVPLNRIWRLPEIHKNDNHLPPFHAIIDTTNNADYGIANLFLLTENEFIVKDSFEAANKIQAILSELFDEGYRFINFDVTSLFSNVPLNRIWRLPEIHKNDNHLPPFHAIIDTTNNADYGIANLFLLTENEFIVKDSFEAANKIQAILSELFDEGYRFINVDVTSLFSNVPLNRTIKMVLKRLYEDRVIRTTLRKRTMKKLIIDLAVKQHSFNNKIFKQIDGVSIGSGLCLVLRNIIMTELENIIVKDLVDKFLIKKYMRFVDDTLLSWYQTYTWTFKFRW